MSKPFRDWVLVYSATNMSDIVHELGLRLVTGMGSSSPCPRGLRTAILTFPGHIFIQIIDKFWTVIRIGIRIEPRSVELESECQILKLPHHRLPHLYMSCDCYMSWMSPSFPFPVSGQQHSINEQRHAEIPYAKSSSILPIQKEGWMGYTLKKNHWIIMALQSKQGTESSDLSLISS